jgi:OTU domain-containing protein 5
MSFVHSEPINTFQTVLDSEYEPIRLSYHRSMHYNSVVNPRKATIGVGLGLPGFQPGVCNNLKAHTVFDILLINFQLAEKNQMKDAKRISEDFHIEQVKELTLFCFTRI